MHNLQILKDGILFVEGKVSEERTLVLVTVDKEGYRAKYVSPIRLTEEINSVQSAALNIVDKVCKDLAFFAETDEEKDEIKSVILDKALLIKDSVDTRAFS